MLFGRTNWLDAGRLRSKKYPRRQGYGRFLDPFPSRPVTLGCLSCGSWGNGGLSVENLHPPHPPPPTRQDGPARLPRPHSRALPAGIHLSTLT